MTLAICLGALIFFMILGMPIAFALVLTGVALMFHLDFFDAQIVAQQKIDAPIKAKALAEQKAREDAQRASFKRLDDKLKAMGI